MPPVIGLAPYPNFFDPAKPKKRSNGKARAMRLRMPSWENVEEAIDFALKPKRDSMYPELFAASRQAKAMPYDKRGRQSVAIISEQQLSESQEAAAGDMRHLTKQLRVMMQGVAQAPPLRPPDFLVEAPPPQPTAAQLRERELRNRVDFIGHLKPEALHVSAEQSSADWLATTVVPVRARGGMTNYPPSQHAHGQPHDVLGLGGVDVLARSVFGAGVPGDLQDRPRSAPSSPAKKDFYFRYNTVGASAAQATNAVGHRVSDSDGAAEGEPFDINEFLSKSVFREDRQQTQARRQHERQEEERAKMQERMRVAAEDLQIQKEAQIRTQRAAQKRAVEQQQAVQEQRDWAEQERHRTKREDDRVAAKLQQRAEEAAAASRRREEVLSIEQQTTRQRMAQDAAAAEKMAASKKREEENEARAAADENKTEATRGSRAATRLHVKDEQEEGFALSIAKSIFNVGAIEQPSALRAKPRAPVQATQSAALPETASSRPPDVVVEGRQDEDNVHVSVPSPASAVIIRRCGSAPAGQVLTHVHVHGECKSVLVEDCQRLVLLVDRVVNKLVVEASDQVRLALAGPVCQEMLLRRSPRTIIHAIDNLTTTTIEATESAYSGFILAAAAAVARPQTPKEIITCAQGYQIILSANETKSIVQGKVQGLPEERQQREAVSAKERAADGAAAAASAAAAALARQKEAEQRRREGAEAQAAQRSGQEAAGAMAQTRMVVQETEEKMVAARAAAAAHEQGRPTAEGPTPQGLSAAKEPPVTLTLTLEEDYDTLCGSSDALARLRQALVRDLASALHSTSSRFEIVSIRAGSIVIDIVISADPLAQDPRSAQQLAAQMTALSNDPASKLRAKPSLLRVSKVELAGKAQPTGPAASVGPRSGRDAALAGIGLRFEMTLRASGELVPVVLALVPDGPAAASGQVAVGDTIMSCDGTACEGKSVEQLSGLFLGLPGSVCRLRLRGMGAGAERTCSLVRRKVVAGGSQRLSDAAGVIADSLMSPSYRKAPAARHSSTFNDTFKRVDAAAAASPTKPEALHMQSTPTQASARVRGENDDRGRGGERLGFSAKKLEEETRLRAQVAMAEAEEAARAEAQNELGLVHKRESVRAQRTTPPEGSNAANAAAASPASPKKTAQTPQSAAAQRQWQMQQQKMHAIKPAPKPRPGMPKVVATVLGARNLPVTEKFGHATPYVIMAIGNSFHKTAAATDASNPTWEQEFEFAVQPALMQGMLLTLTVEDVSAALRDEPIGQLSVPLLQLLTRKEWEGWFDLKTIKAVGEPVGPAAVKLRLAFEPGLAGETGGGQR